MIAEPGSAMIVEPASYLVVPPSTRSHNPFVTGLLFENLCPNISPFQAAEEQKRSEEWDQPILCHISEKFEAIVLQATFFWQLARGM